MRIGATLFVAALAVPGVAYAQNSSVNSSCERQAKSICAPAVSARLIGASGDVLLSRGVGFAEIKAGATLVAGDRLLVKQGSAEISIGPACQAKLGTNSLITLVEKNGRLCAAGLLANSNTVAADLPSRVPPQVPRQVVTEPYTESPLLPSLIFAGAGFGIVAAAAALDRDDDRRAFFPLPLSP
jgi:hypothetical protein